MRDNRCFICKFLQKEVLKDKDDVLYDGKGNTMSLPLCYSHSVEFYKIGQSNFLLKHRNIFIGSYGYENDSDILDFFPGHKKDRAWI